jgi:hypothetical protein
MSAIGTFREWLREEEARELNEVKVNDKLTLKEIKYAVSMIAEDLLNGSDRIRKVTGNENKIVIHSKYYIFEEKHNKWVALLKKYLDIDYEVTEYKEYDRINDYVLTLTKKK